MSTQTILIKVNTVSNAVIPLKTCCCHTSGQFIDKEGQIVCFFIFLAISHISCHVQYVSMLLAYFVVAILSTAALCWNPPREGYHPSQGLVIWVIG